FAEARQSELASARQHGADVVDWVETYYAGLERFMGDMPNRPTGWNHGACFPNMCLSNVGSALRGPTILLAMPKAPDEIEVWRYYLTSKRAPQKVGEPLLQANSQAPAGIVGIDDTENYDRMVDMTRTPMARTMMSHFNMGHGQDGAWPGAEQWS